MPRLNKEKQRAFNLVKDGENLFITGKAGTGKTFLLDAIRKTFKGEKVMTMSFLKYIHKQ